MVARRDLGSRLIVIDGRSYRWRVPRRPVGEDQALGWGPLRFAAWLDGHNGALLEVDAAGPRPDNCFRTPGAVITPRRVADLIRRALVGGWEPSRPGPSFVLRDSGPA